MSINEDLEAKILRYYHVEKWRIGTIARQLHVHHHTVERVLCQTGIPKAKIFRRPLLIDPFLPFIQETLKKYPNLRASRLYHMVCERGYTGATNHFRHQIALYRPRPYAEAYLRLKSLPGEQGQVDWAHFGHITVGRAQRPLMAFVMVLSFSRKIFLRFYLNYQMANFLRGHEAAFQAWNGIPRVLLFDNLKSCTLERVGDAIRFNPKLLEFAAHYRFEPRPVAVARGNEKGRVERAIRYIRDNFFAARQWKDLDDLNAQAIAWCEGPAANRPCPEDLSMSVRDAFTQEKSMLINLPDNPYPTDEHVEVVVSKTPYVRFDRNDYSVPHTHVRRTLTVLAQLDQIIILDGTTIIAQHMRSYDKGQTIEQESHIKALEETKRHSHQHSCQNRLIKSIPLSSELLIKAAERGYKLSSIIISLLRLLNVYGVLELEAAIAEALSRDVPHPNAVRMSLEKRREQRELQPLIELHLPDDQRVRDLIIRPHALNDYDQTTTIITEQEIKS